MALQLGMALQLVTQTVPAEDPSSAPSSNIRQLTPVTLAPGNSILLTSFSTCTPVPKPTDRDTCAFN